MTFETPTFPPSDALSFRAPTYRIENRGSSLAAAVPNGIQQGELLVKDSAALSQATGSKSFTGFVHVGIEPVESDEPRGE